MTYGMWRTTGMSTDALHATFEKAGKEIACADCWTVLRARIQEVCWQWSQVKVRALLVVRNNSPCCAAPIPSLVAENNLNHRETIGRMRAD